MFKLDSSSAYKIVGPIIINNQVCSIDDLRRNVKGQKNNVHVNTVVYFLKQKVLTTLKLLNT